MPERPQRNRDRVGAVGDADQVPDAQIRRELGLEGFDLRAEHVSSARDDGLEPCQQRPAERLERGLGVEQRDRHIREETLIADSAPAGLPLR